MGRLNPIHLIKKKEMIIIANKSNKIGSKFENRLTKQFEKYRKEGKAYIFKVPTEFVVLRKGAKIISAFPKKQSPCLDYIGILPNGKSIVFEAKTTANKTSFPLSNIKDYQYDLIDEIQNYANNVFFVIEFREYNEVYLVSGLAIREFKENNLRKSIPYKEFKNIGILMNDLDVLKYINY